MKPEMKPIQSSNEITKTENYLGKLINMSNKERLKK